MVPLRSFLSVTLSILLANYTPPLASAASLPVGILTLADRAYIEEGAAYPGLSVFEGEHLSTGREGRLGLRSGQSTLALGANAEVTLFKPDSGIHVDLSAGSVIKSLHRGTVRRVPPSPDRSK
jgi:hypothetical protein